MLTLIVIYAHVANIKESKLMGVLYYVGKEVPRKKRFKLMGVVPN